MNLFEILILRAIGGLAIFFVMALRPSLFGHVALRSPQHASGAQRHAFRRQPVLGDCLTVLPLATVFAIEFTVPVWAAVLAVLFLGERLTARRDGTVVLGILGVLVILRPGIEAFQPAALGVLLASLGYALSNIGTKKLIPVQSTFAILFWMNVMQIRFALIGTDPRFRSGSRGMQWVWACGIASAARRALLPHQCPARRRRNRGHPARFPAHPADRVRRLDVLRRAAGPAGVRGRRHHRAGISGTCAPRCGEIATPRTANRASLFHRAKAPCKSRIVRGFDSHFRHV